MNAVSARPLFLLLDGHSTHYQPQLIRFAKEHDVIILCLPPHTTHESQPLDVGVFAPLKRQCTQVCHDFYQANPGKMVTKFNFMTLFAKAWCNALSPGNSFRRAGVYPVNKGAILLPEKDQAKSSSSSSSSGPTQQANNHSTTPAKSNGLSESGASSCPSVTTPTGACGATPTSHTLTSSSTFTPDQLRLFEHRYEEGFNVYEDKDHVCWLEIHHPDALPSDRDDLVSSEVSPETNNAQDPADMSIAAHFQHVPPLTGVSSEDDNTADKTSSELCY